jgi:hypothetical protein
LIKDEATFTINIGPIQVKITPKGVIGGFEETSNLSVDTQKKSVKGGFILATGSDAGAEI